MHLAMHRLEPKFVLLSIIQRTNAGRNFDELEFLGPVLFNASLQFQYASTINDRNFVSVEGRAARI